MSIANHYQCQQKIIKCLSRGFTMNKTTAISSTALAMALVLSACSNEDGNPTNTNAQNTATENGRKSPKEILATFKEIARREHTAPSEETKPTEVKAETTRPTEAQQTETQPVEEKPAAAKQDAPKRIPVAGTEFPHSFTAKNGENRTIGIDVDKLVVATTPDGKKALALTVAFAKQFDIYDPAVMARLSPASRRLIEEGDTNMSTNGTDVALMVNHVMKAHGVPKNAMRDAYNACKSYFPELTQ